MNKKTRVMVVATRRDVFMVSFPSPGSYSSLSYFETGLLLNFKLLGLLLAFERVN